MAKEKEIELYPKISEENMIILTDAYDFLIDDEGYIWGLVAGDHGWEKTTIKAVDQDIKAGIRQKGIKSKTKI